jgi:ATP-dependent exoDNAse (exonuclease V) beta subunit
MPLDGDDLSIARLAEMHGRVLGATSDEVTAADAIGRQVLRHPLTRDAARAQQAGQCYRETPMTWRLGGTTIVEGNVDLAFVNGGQVIVVDFKTDRELGEELERYRRQVQIYAAAIGAALNRPTRGVLMRV